MLPLLCAAALAQEARPLADLPAGVAAPDGKLTMFADFEAKKDGFVPVYVVNRTAKPVLLPAQDGDPFLKLEGRAQDGAWERAQSHMHSWCGNSYFPMPKLAPQTFHVFRGKTAAAGRKTKVRYRLYSLVPLVSNVGEGLVDPKEIEAAKRDRMAVDFGDYAFVSRAATVPGAVPVQTRYAAIRNLKRFKEKRTVQLLAKLLAEEDPTIRLNALNVATNFGPFAKELEPLVRPLANDPAVGVNRAARKALTALAASDTPAATR